LRGVRFHTKWAIFFSSLKYFFLFIFFKAIFMEFKAAKN
jgi:hypothetical protein